MTMSAYPQNRRNSPAFTGVQIPCSKFSRLRAHYSTLRCRRSRVSSSEVDRRDGPQHSAKRILQDTFSRSRILGQWVKDVVWQRRSSWFNGMCLLASGAAGLRPTDLDPQEGIPVPCWLQPGALCLSYLLRLILRHRRRSSQISLALSLSFFLFFLGGISRAP